MGEHLTGAAQRKKIMQTFWIMFAITGLEFVFAFAFEKAPWLAITFLVMTVAKAFFIVAEFMHLKHEVRELILTISLPMIFILWFIVAMLVEGDWYNGGWFRYLTE